jgi:hypothetical protein
MILQATISKRNGKPSCNDISNIIEFLHSQNAEVFDITDTSSKIDYLYSVASLVDPQSFYQYLSQNKYTLISSKLTQDCKLKQKSKQ